MSDMKGLKIGDKLVCIKSTNMSLVIGSEYIVTFIRRDREDNPVEVKIKGYNAVEQCFYAMSRFKKITNLTPHPQRDVIIAWANGEAVQVCVHDEWMDFLGNSKERTPQWHIYNWRVKPKPSEKDIKIQEIQDKMDKLREELNELKGG